MVESEKDYYLILHSLTLSIFLRKDNKLLFLFDLKLEFCLIMFC